MTDAHHYLYTAYHSRPESGRWRILAILLLAAVLLVVPPLKLHTSISLRHVLAYAAVLVLAAVPVVQRNVLTFLAGLAAPSRRTRALVTISVGVLSIIYLFATAQLQHRDLFAKWHDEFMYLTQARLLAHGRLWMPGHPLHEFFESFYLFTQPKYAPISFPGTSMLFVPAIWLSLPKWVVPLIISGACVALVYRIITELIDGVAGLLAVGCVLGLQVFRFQSLMAMANLPMLLLALLMVYAWLKWRDRLCLRYAALIGVAMGWAAITRPADALAAAIPVCVAMLLDLRGKPFKLAAASLLTLVACAIPFLLIQVVFNVGFSGQVTTLPYTRYCELYYPHLEMGVPVFDPSAKPQTAILQKQLMYEDWLVPYIRAHQPGNWVGNWLGDRIPAMLRTCVASPLLLLLAPLGLLGLTDRRRKVVFAVFPSCMVIYGLLTVFNKHYSCLSIAAVAMLILIGAERIQRSFPYPFLRVALPGLLAASILLSLPEFTHGARDDEARYDMPVIARSLDLPGLVHQPAIVLFRFTRGQNFHEEPVYNPDVIWPDEAPIIRAHDLGDEKNLELYRYYAARQPDRTIYRLDRADPTLTPVRLGTARELAR